MQSYELVDQVDFVKSSNISFIGYRHQGDQTEFYVGFKGKDTYRYEVNPAFIVNNYSNLLKAESVGKAFNILKKDLTQYEKIEKNTKVMSISNIVNENEKLKEQLGLLVNSAQQLLKACEEVDTNNTLEEACDAMKVALKLCKEE